MKILVADDDRELIEILAFTLQRAGFEVVRAMDGEQALTQFKAHQPALVLLDGMMPGLDGFQVCERLRAESAVPIIMLTVLEKEEEVLRAFELGADDYVTKPFSPKQLVARVKAALRRNGAHAPSALAIGDLQLDAERHEARRNDGVRIRLTPLEFRLLKILMANCGKVMDVEVLVEQVWGHKDHVGERQLLKGLVRRVREKVETDPSRPEYIKTVAGAGYVFSPRIGR
ncbi:MAG: response regulator transcription factor [Chloroflexi bacterium]|nr:response regulator transcription factor [Chloroflexota bacterium]